MKFYELTVEQTRALDSKVQTTRASYPWDTTAIGACFLIPQEDGKAVYRPSAPAGIRKKGKEFTSDVVKYDLEGNGFESRFVRIIRTN